MNSKTDNADLSRRAFLRGSLITREGREALHRSVQPLGPRPPWHSAEDLADACGNCDEAPCVSACPERLIRLHGADHALQGQPYLEFSEAGCTLCGGCVDSCPLGLERDAIAPFLPAVELRQDICLTHNGVICMSCLGHCRSRALRLQLGGRIVLDNESCIGCGACLAVCPVDALKILPCDLNSQAKPA